MLSSMFPLFVVVCTERNRAGLLALFFLRIALLAGLAVFRGFDAALVSAFFSGGFGLFAAGFSASDAHTGENGDRANECGECFN